MLDVVSFLEAVLHELLKSYFGEPLLYQVRGNKPISTDFRAVRFALFYNCIVKRPTKNPYNGWYTWYTLTYRIHDCINWLQDASNHLLYLARRAFPRDFHCFGILFFLKTLGIWLLVGRALDLWDDDGASCLSSLASVNQVTHHVYWIKVVGCFMSCLLDFSTDTLQSWMDPNHALF